MLRATIRFANVAGLGSVADKAAGLASRAASAASEAASAGADTAASAATKSATAASEAASMGGDKVAGLAARTVAAASEAASMGKFAVLGKTGNLDAVVMLTGQHREAESQLEKTLKATDAVSRRMLLDRLCNSVACHMRVEEELFYPEMEKLPPFDNKDKQKQEDEHGDVKGLIKKLLATNDVLSDDVTQMLKEMESDLKKHHAREEEHIFPKVQSHMAEAARTALGEKMRQRFTELHAQENPRGVAEKPLKQA
jgi:hemerythrin superfamily protein